MAKPKWASAVDRKDFDAGRQYLELLYPASRAKALVRSLKRTAIRSFVAKDILRASELELLPAREPDVAKQMKRIARQEKLSPLLLVRESDHARLIIADGFHRLCAAMHTDEQSMVPCKIA